MELENIFGITDSAELERVQEQISKKKAAWLFESGRLDELILRLFSLELKEFDALRLLPD